MKKLLLAAIMGTAMLATAVQAAPRHMMRHAPADRGAIKVGVLTCQIAPGVGLILGSSKAARCTFKRNHGGTEYYSGSMGKLGIDIGVTNTSHLGWVVFAPGDVRRGALEGSYVGASAQATVAVGLGANALVGGFNHNINLQPFSVQGQTGLNVAAGLGSLTLHFVR
jgi:hypothetical protein